LNSLVTEKLISEDLNYPNLMKIGINLQNELGSEDIRRKILDGTANF
jgi:hypothetical protein